MLEQEYEFAPIDGSRFIAYFENNNEHIVVKMPKYLFESFKECFPEAVFNAKSSSFLMKKDYLERMKQWGVAINDYAEMKHSELVSPLSLSELEGIASLSSEGQEFKLGKSLTSLDKLNTKPARPEMVFAGLQAASVGSIVAGGSTGKGFFCLSLLLDLTTGLNTLGINAAPADVTGEKPLNIKPCAFITYEDNEDIIDERMYSLHTSFSDHPNYEDYKLLMSKTMHVESKVGEVHHIVRADGSINKKLIDQMVPQFQGFRLIVLDTLSLMNNGDLMSDTDMKNFVAALGGLAKRTGAAVLFTHHCNKQSLTNGAHASTSASKGSTALSDNIRFQINLSKMTESEAEEFGVDKNQIESFVRYSTPKTNYSAGSAGRWLMRHEGGILKSEEL